MMMDNHRVLHGRTKFDPEEGKRFLQGCYIDFDSTEGKLRHLKENLIFDPSRFINSSDSSNLFRIWFCYCKTSHGVFASFFIDGLKVYFCSITFGLVVSYTKGLSKKIFLLLL